MQESQQEYLPSLFSLHTVTWRLGRLLNAEFYIGTDGRGPYHLLIFWHAKTNFRALKKEKEKKKRKKTAKQATSVLLRSKKIIVDQSASSLKSLPLPASSEGVLQECI